MVFPAFCGPAYTSRSPIADVERLVNLYLEPIESGNGKNQFAMYALPGLTAFATVGSGPIRGEIACQDGNLYVVSGDSLFKVTSGAVATNLGVVGTSSGNPPVFMAASSTQLLIISAGDGYVYTFTTGVLAQIVDPQFPADVEDCDYSDGYFIVLADNVVYLSAVDDATSWAATDFLEVASSANNLIGISVDHRQLIVYGDRITQVFNSTGSANIFDADPSGIIQMGLLARASVARLDNTSFFLGQNENGQGCVFRFNGYTPQRVSNHAVESAIQSYASLSDAVAFGWQFQGHPFYRISFPNAISSGVGRTWEYDASLPPNIGWHEVSYYNNGAQAEALGRCYAFAFGKHLVGARNSAIIYELSATAYMDGSTTLQAIRRVRIPNDEKKWFFMSRFELDMQMGVGLQVASTALGYDPQVLMRFSHDGGYTWSGYRQASMGRIGQYSARVFWTRFRAARDPVIEISVTDPVFRGFANAFIEGKAGNN